MDITVEYTDNSRQIKAGMEDAVLKALEECGLAAEGYAKDLCPVGTPESTGIPGYIGGTLRNSIAYALAGKKPDISKYKDNAGNEKGTYNGTAPKDDKYAVYIGTNVEYAAYVEKGTLHMKAQPYLKPAITDHRDDYKRIIEDNLKE